MTDTITMPRSVVEQALKLWDAQSIDENYDYGGAFLLWDEHARPEDLALQFRAALEQPQVEQEPVGCITGTYGGYPVVRLTNPALVLPFGTALYTRPQNLREPLTEADLYDIAGNYFADEWAQKQAVMMLKDHGIGGKA